MKENLPNVFANPIDKPLDNGQSVFYSKDDDRGSLHTNLDDVSVATKINKIFNSPNFIYKSEVELETDFGYSKKTIVGKSGNSLLTMDNEVIPISSIKNIRKI